MNCREVDSLLPLYVGGDLEDRRMKLVTVHIQSCAKCAGLAKEYGEAQQFVKLFAPPHFSESVYTGIRSRVLAQIENEADVPTLFQQLAALFQPRVMWPASAAVLLAVSVLAFYFIFGRTNQQRPLPEVAGIPRDVDPARMDQPKDVRTPVQELATSSSRETGPSTGSGATAKKPSPVFNGYRYGQRRPMYAGRNQPTRVIRAEALAMSRQASMPAQSLAESQSNPLDTPAAPEKVLRVEMQTSDPNIRIVWFSQLSKTNISNDSRR